MNPSPSAANSERHRLVYATPGLPPLAVHGVENQLLAGRNPLTVVDVVELQARGVTHVVDLREDAEWSAPGRFGAEAVAELDVRGIKRLAVPVRDQAAPPGHVLEAAVRWIRDALKAPDAKVFVHCRAGRERTGAVLAAYLVSCGAPLDAALTMLRSRCGAAPLPAQVAAVREWASSRTVGRNVSRRDRIRGCLLGGAIGDALGAGIEFDSLATIRRKYGSAGVAGFVPAYGIVGAITDDTQMTLFTAEGLIRARQAGATDVAPMVRFAYLRWLDTQGDAAGVVGADQALGPGRRGWLVDVPVLRHERAPGTTCLAGLRSGRLGSTTNRLNDRKGCGGVMRVAPIGLVSSSPFDLACAVAALTHGHPSGFVAAGAFAVAIAAATSGASVRHCIEAARASAAADAEGAELVAAIDRALQLAASGRATPELLETLGGGWVAEEALAIALYCVLVEPDVRLALLLAVNHSGDSDSTGSMVGQLLGAIHGVDALPQDWIAAVEGREVVERVADDLADRFIEDKDLDLGRYPPG